MSDTRLGSLPNVSHAIGTLPVANGGTGQTSYIDGQLLIGNSSTSSLTKATLTAGTNITITNGNGSISIAATAGSGSAYNVTSQTTAYNASINDYVICSSSSFTVTLPTAVSQAGKSIVIQHNGTSITQVYTLNTTSAQTIGGIASGSYALYTNGEVLTLVSDGSNWQIPEHYAVTPWSSTTTTTFTAGTSGTFTKGTNTTDTIQWRRVGDMCNVRMNYRQTGAGSNGSGVITITIPGGITGDTSFYGVNTGTNAPQACGFQLPGYVGMNTDTTNGIIGGVHFYDSTHFALHYESSITGVWGSASIGLANATTNVLANFFFPVSGWQP